MRFLVPASRMLVVCLSLAAARSHAATDDELAALRAELQALKSSYESRLQALEARLRAAESANAAAPPAAPAVAQAPGTPAPGTTAPNAAGAPASNAFNPALSLILAGAATRTSHDPARYAITGFAVPPDAEIGPGTRGFNLGESELAITANIDPWWRGAANISLSPDNSVEVEEAFVQTTSLGGGLTFKAGRFLSGIGYLNLQHAHTWDFADAPLAYQALLGGQLGDDGVQLNWLAPTDQFVEVGVELGRGRGFPGSDASANGAGRASLALHTGGDIGDSHSWRAGVSYMTSKARDQTLSVLDANDAAIDSVFDGRTRTTIVDAVWKWAPNGNATRTNFKLQAEWLRSARDGSLAYDVTGANTSGDYTQTLQGWYLQAVYQFMPRWRVGARTERLSADSPSLAAATLFDAQGFHPRKNTLMVDYSASEFSRLRVQFARDQARVGVIDNQWTLQYQMSLGAHGAHSF
jgi:hypothetical protein